MPQDPQDQRLKPARPTINVAGKDEAALQGGLMDLLVVETTSGLYRCEARFGNWGKVGGGVGLLYLDRKLLDFGKALKISIGDDPIFEGKITAIEGHFLEGASPEITVLAEDRLEKLRVVRRSRSFADLSDADLAARTSSAEARGAAAGLVRARRALRLRIAGETRLIAVEDAARYRDGLGIPMPAGVPEALLAPVRDPLGDLALRYARTHAPFTAADFAARYGLTTTSAESVLLRLTSENRLLEGEFRPGGTRREWTDADVLRMIRRRSLARLRREVEPVDQDALGRFTTAWQGLTTVEEVLRVAGS